MAVTPADEIYSFAVTIPAATAKASPLVTSVGIPPRDVNQINITVPPGPSGLVGFQIGMVGVPVIPRNSGGFIVADGRIIEWPVKELADSGAWQVIGYNTDIYDHTIYVEFLVNLIVVSNISGTSSSGTPLSQAPQSQNTDTAVTISNLSG